MKYFRSALLCSIILGVALLVASAATAADASAGVAPEGGGAFVPKSGCNAFAVCHDGSTVSCSGSGTCTGVDAACPRKRGYVVCDGVTTSCPACPALACGLEGDPCYDTQECRDGSSACSTCWCIVPVDQVGVCICP